MSASLLDTRSFASARSFTPSRWQLWTGRVMSGLVVIALTFDVVLKLIRDPHAVQGTAQLGFPPDALLVIGILGLICLVLYVIPRTAIIGAILWVGYFGGTIATHLRLGNPLFTHVLSGVYVCVFLWGGLYLRDPRVRALFAPVR